MNELAFAIDDLDYQLMPDGPGLWYWREWGATVEVYKKKGGKYLYVTPPKGVEVRITDRIAGGWKRALSEGSQSGGVPDPQRGASNNGAEQRRKDG